MYNVYVKGYVGNLGTKVLIEEKYYELINYFGKEFINEEKQKLENLNLIKDGLNPSLSIYKENIKDIEEITKGGFLTALWKICDRNKWGLRYNLRLVPIYQSTVEIANYFDINPYRLLTKDAYIYVIDDIDDINDTMFSLKKIEEFNNREPLITELFKAPNELTKIGKITNEKRRVRIDSESEAFLTKDYKDEIDKVINKYTKKKDG